MGEREEVLAGVRHMCVKLTYLHVYYYYLDPEEQICVPSSQALQ